VAFALGVQRQAETPFRALGLVNVIRVSPKRDKDAGRGPALDDAALQRIEALPGVEAAYPDFRVRGLKIALGDKTTTAVAIGLPRDVPLPGTAGDLLVAGEYFTPGTRPEIILGTQVARDLGLDTPQGAIGATLRLETSGLAPAEAAKTFTFERKDLAVTVVGVYDLPNLMAGKMSGAVLLPVDLMRQIPGVESGSLLDRLKLGADPTQPGYPEVTVRVRRHTDVAPVDKAIQAMGFRTRTLLSRLEDMRTFFLFMDVLLAAVGAVALLVAGLGIINTLLISVLERYQEIGICKAIGASDGDVFVLFLTEAGAIGLIGGLCGLALGRAVCWGLEAAINSYARAEGITAYLEVFAFPLWLVTATVLFSAGISVLAGVYPAVRAARTDPIRALRRE
ncbi:MAG TPA: FtsX-like permease family protein, partial [Planctomycetota bacterium]|nr:FtsX-like permease family protein [Planctomycetota bacterium]